MSELVLLMAIIVGVSFAGQLRRGDPGQRGYLLVTAGVLMSTVIATLRADRFLAVIAVALGVLVVVLPWLLDVLVRLAFARERLSLAVRMAGWRTMLMPGAGLARQQAILRGLAELERRGVDGALAYFRRLVQETEDDAELRVIHEQIVSMLLFGQRWSEGIAHYEAQFPRGYAAQRPPLALGLLRAYGESGKLRSAAELLQAIEEILGRDPRTAGVVSQARLTFLAYAGRSEPVTSALTDERRRRLGLSAASGALFRGIALSRAGRTDAAQAELRTVEGLAKPRDERVVHASRRAIAGLPEESEPVELAPELETYVERVADRLEAFLRVAPSVRRVGPLWVTPLLMGLLGFGYLAVLALDGGGTGLLELGAMTPELVRSGSWGRILTGMVVQLDPIGLLLSAYGVWLAGPLVERLYGRARMLLVSVGAGAVGMVASVVFATDPTAVIAGASLMCTGVVTAALWVLVSPGTNLPRRTRRVLALPLLMIALALAVTVPQTGRGLDLPLMGMLASVLAGLSCVGLASPRGVLAVALRGVAVVVALAIPVAGVLVALEDPQAHALEHRYPRTTADVALQVPAYFEVVPEAAESDEGGPWPLQPGLHDVLAERVGDRVQVLVTTPSRPDTSASEAAATKAEAPRAEPMEAPAATTGGTIDGMASFEPPPSAADEVAVPSVRPPEPDARSEVDAAAADAAPEPSPLLRIVPKLARELVEVPGTPPAAWAEAYAARAGDEALAALRTWILRRNGQDVGVVIERVVDDGPGATAVVLVASPPEALEHAPQLYAAVLADAHRVRPDAP